MGRFNFKMSAFAGPFLGAAIIMAAAPGNAFTPDEFDSATLGEQWEFVDLSPDTNSTYTLEDGHLVLEGGLNSDHYWFINTHAIIQQPAPEGTNWEVVVKFDGWDPTQAGQQRMFTRAGIQLWQDNEHFITISSLSSGDGLFVDSQNMWRFDPDMDTSNDEVHKGITQLNGFPGVPHDTFWMKIQKTPRGYLGYIGTTGSDWLECLNVVKNPETPDGYMTDAKIRLFNGGGFHHDGGTQAATPVKFDFVHTNAITPPSGAYQDDEFTGTELGGNWSVHSGVAPGFVGLNAGELVITAGPFANMWGDVEQPTFIYQDAPTAANYDVTVKVGPTLMHQIPYELWNSYGLWLWRDQLNFAFISNQPGDEPNGEDPPVWLPINRIEAGAKVNGQFYNGIISFGTDPAPEYLRIERNGTDCQLMYSYDNADWLAVELDVNPDPNITELSSNFAIGADSMQTRLFSKRVFGDGDDQAPGIQNPPLDGHFDWIHSSEGTSGISDWQLF